MPVIKMQSTGALARVFNDFLVEQGYLAAPSAVFDAASKEATQRFQQSLIDAQPKLKGRIGVDGIPGNQTLGFACARNRADGLHPQSIAQAVGVAYPMRDASLPRQLDQAAQEELFGQIGFVPAPSAADKERIRITNGWDVRHIVRLRIPQLVGMAGAPASGQIYVHKAVAAQYVALFAAWDRQGILAQLTQWGGSYVPRYVRGSTTSLSNHAYGTAFDVNTSANWLSHLPAFPGENGSLFAHVQAAQAFGFSWGGFYEGRLDGMHFEAMRVMDEGQIAAAAARF